jgi:hypothetical protein
METVVVERLFPSPVSFEEIAASREAGRWCADLYGVSHLRAYIEPAGLRTVCIYRAPDVQAVRNINHRLGGTYERMWRGSMHVDGGDPDPSSTPGREDEVLAVVERSLQAGTGLAELSRIEAGGRWCMDQHRIRFLCTYVAADSGRMLCVYAAPDAESVRIAQRTIGMPVDRVWPARLLER